MDNIAEGYERGGNRVFIQYLYIAKASCGELRSHFYVALDAGYPDASHFSHSIRDVFGLTPRSIVSGSRRLSLFGEGDASAPGEVAPPPRA